ncbi:MAG TPA: sugar phosphate nucleotidyltransferase [Steroidobacteraceae bacterium]|jgi:glucose-1-phosphate cytidylyltransferase|nr:sugar phosphate nucleotidyltransferase [Steroidobacteraceae bacterium]
MKVVLFCGGLGTRLREHSDTVPKSLVNIGPRPIIWHLMRYYAHHGHKEFILCLGYRGDMIREYFLKYNEAISNDFTLSRGGRHIELHSSDLDDWRITFVDTGLHSNIGERLLRARPYLGRDPMFLANYTDGLSDLPLDQQLEQFRNSSALVSVAAVSNSQSFHSMTVSPDGQVSRIGAMADQVLINGGYFAFRREIFDYMKPGEELVEEPFQRLIAAHKLLAFQWGGFWRCMDTFKDKITFDRMEGRGECPWMVWQHPEAAPQSDPESHVPPLIEVA